MQTLIDKQNEGNSPLWKRVVSGFLHWSVLVLSVGLIVLITHETLKDVSFLDDGRYLDVQFYVCLFFLFDIFVEWLLSDDKKKYLWHHLLFLLVSIPYLNIVHHFGWQVTPQVSYLLRFVPMLRAGYVLAIVSGALTHNKATSLFYVYIIFAVASLYFASLMFFVAEHGINSGVDSYWSALWWGAMDMTTAGSNINPITNTGKALSIVLSCEGLILFPVFTVYFTNVITGKSTSTQPA